MISDEEFKKLKEANPRGVVQVETALGTAVFKCPDAGQWKHHIRMASDTKTAPDAIEWLARACVVHPSRDIFDRWIDEKPGIAATVLKHIHKLAGVDQEAEAKE
jgi:hypothetical protein